MFIPGIFRDEFLHNGTSPRDVKYRDVHFTVKCLPDLSKSIKVKVSGTPTGSDEKRLSKRFNTSLQRFK